MCPRSALRQAGEGGQQRHAGLYVHEMQGTVLISPLQVGRVCQSLKNRIIRYTGALQPLRSFIRTVDSSAYFRRMLVIDLTIENIPENRVTQLEQIKCNYLQDKVIINSRSESL